MDKEILEHKKMHTEIELMHEEAKPKITESFNRLKKSHRNYMISGSIIAVGLISSTVIAFAFVENPLVRTIVAMGLVFGTSNHIVELIHSHHEFKKAQKGYDEFMNLDLSFEDSHKEFIEEEPKTKKVAN